MTNVADAKPAPVEKSPVEATATDAPADTVATAVMKPVNAEMNQMPTAPVAAENTVADNGAKSVVEQKTAADINVQKPVNEESKTVEGAAAPAETPVENENTESKNADDLPAALPTGPAPKEHTDLPAPLPTGPASKENAELPGPLPTGPAPKEAAGELPTKPSSKVLSPSAAVYIPPSVLAQKAAIAAGRSPTGSLPPATPTRRPPTSAFLSTTPRTPLSAGGRTPLSARSARSPRACETTPGGAVELTAKQVRELRRLCRKTANRAEYEGRLVQLRQIASILAMGGPSLVHFAPSYLTADSALQSWIDVMRAGGADWRDERPLGAAAVEELREWDRLLKAWARRRFPTLETAEGGAAPPTTPRSKRLDLMALTSPVAGDTPSPRGGPRTPSSARAGRSNISMSRGDEVIHITIVRGDDGRMQVGAGPETPGSWRAGSPGRDQENHSPAAEEAKNRDWGTLRRNEAGTNVAATAATVTPALKARNW